VAIAFRSATTLAPAATGGSINVPAGVVNNDMLLLSVACPQPGRTVTATGWTQVTTLSGDSIGASGKSLTHVTFYRRASSEPASYNITTNTTFSTSVAMVMLAYTGVITTGSPIRTSNTINQSGTFAASKISAALTGVQATDKAVHLASAVTDDWTSLDYTLTGPGGSWADRASAINIASDAVPGTMALDDGGTGSAPTVTTAGAATTASDVYLMFAGLALIEEPSSLPPSQIITRAAVRRASTW
jgi:hypothetical protein